MRNKIIASITTFALLGMVVFPVAVSAAGLGFPTISRYETLEEIVNAFLSLLRFVVVILLVIAIMYGGITRITSQGDADKIAKSQKIIVSAIIGFAIVVLAPVIVEFVGTLVGAENGVFSFPS